MASEGQPLSHTLNENLLKTIFNNAEVICNINSNLLAKLEKRWESWNYDSKLGDVFLSTVCLSSLDFFSFMLTIELRWNFSSVITNM